MTFKNRVKSMSVERTIFIRRIQITRRIIFHDHIDSTSQSISSQTIRHNPLVDFHTLYHISRNVVEIYEITELSDGSLVHKKSHTLTFKSSYRNTRWTSHTACASYSDTSHTIKHFVKGRSSTLQLTLSH